LSLTLRTSNLSLQLFRTLFNACEHRRFFPPMAPSCLQALPNLFSCHKTFPPPLNVGTVLIWSSAIFCKRPGPQPKHDPRSHTPHVLIPWISLPLVTIRKPPGPSPLSVIVDAPAVIPRLPPNLIESAPLSDVFFMFPHLSVKATLLPSQRLVLPPRHLR